jgi:hypothetical protein
MTRRWAALLVVLLGASVTAAEKPEAVDRFVPLFDGKTFTGWEGNLQVFRIQDGAIAACLGSRFTKGDRRKRGTRTSHRVPGADQLPFNLRQRFEQVHRADVVPDRLHRTAGVVRSLGLEVVGVLAKRRVIGNEADVTPLGRPRPRGRRECQNQCKQIVQLHGFSHDCPVYHAGMLNGTFTGMSNDSSAGPGCIVASSVFFSPPPGSSLRSLCSWEPCWGCTRGGWDKNFYQ